MKLIFNLYQNTKACVKLNNELSKSFTCNIGVRQGDNLKLNNELSKSFTCNIGVRQGDNLSPLLFAIFVNDFEQFISTQYNGLNEIKTLYTDMATNDEIMQMTP